MVILDEGELVRGGLERMLAAYAGAAVLLPAAEPGTASPPCDLELYDPAYDRARVVEGTLPPHPPGRVVAYSWDTSRDAVSTELARGAVAYISKRAPADRLVRALVRAGGGQVVVEVGDPHPRTTRAAAPEAQWPLTPRETAVLALIAHGLSNQDIAEELALSLNSIKSYIRSAYRKIEVASRSQAVLWAVRHGLLSWEPDATPRTTQVP
ncbi:MAG: response regulator transcription factor [Nocardioides sp.]|nr:response regulator transcription factor [Nocardioides sp.]